MHRYVCGFGAGSLQIRQSLETDEGRYECVAVNNVGIAYSYAADLYVRGTTQWLVPLSSRTTCQFVPCIQFLKITFWV